jgi:peptidoglycan/LPS O-acetylase OafA/YrhL
VLSGFLITGILLDQRGGPSFLCNFYMRHVLRVFPVYYATLVGVFIVFPLLTGSASIPLRESWWFWVYLQNIPPTFAPAAVSGPAHFWSLAVEEEFYLVWPLLVLLLGRAGLWRAASIAVLLSVALRAVLVASGHHYLKLAIFDGLATVRCWPWRATTGLAASLASNSALDGCSSCSDRCWRSANSQ